MRRSFDLLAKPYRWMEYATFGRALQRCRTHFLREVQGAREVLVLGDGDGRFSARVLTAAPQAFVTAIDCSAGMLAALRVRCAVQGAGDRLITQQADLQHGLPVGVCGQQYDLVASHFFLDCMSETQIAQLADELLPLLKPGALWIVSEFHVPSTWLQLPARLLIHSLYLAFRLLTGLRTQHLPDYGRALTRNGYVLQKRELLLAGLLTAEVWAAPYQPLATHPVE